LYFFCHGNFLLHGANRGSVLVTAFTILGAVSSSPLANLVAVLRAFLVSTGARARFVTNSAFSVFKIKTPYGVIPNRTAGSPIPV